MTIAYACILIVALLPYLWTAVAKAGAQQYDNRDPRGWLARQDNPRVKRASAAHQNAFEALPAFAAGVLMAQFAGVDPPRIAMLALAFTTLRVLHGIFYIANLAPLRSLAWLGGMGCMLALMGQAIVRIG